jgi:hypothetical protein
MASRMNSAIVATYSFSGKYNSLIMSTCKVIAVGLSAFSIVSAMINLSLTSSPGAVAPAIEYGFSGLLLAVLIEGITLVCLSLIRGQWLKAYRSTEDAVKAQCYLLIRWLAPFAGFGILMSATAGDLFWYQLLSAEPLWKTIAMSIAFALVVSFCFLISELFAVLIELEMAEGMDKGQDLRKAAFAAEHADTQLELMRESYQELLADKEQRDAIKDDLKGKLKQGLLNSIAQINIEAMTTPTDHQLAAPATENLPLLEAGNGTESVNPDTELTCTDLLSAQAQEVNNSSTLNTPTAELVAVEYSKMLSAGKKPTQTAIATILGISRQAVAPHFNALLASNVKGA